MKVNRGYVMIVQRYGLAETFGLNVECNLGESGNLKEDYRVYVFRKKLIPAFPSLPAKLMFRAFQSVAES